MLPLCWWKYRNPRKICNISRYWPTGWRTYCTKNAVGLYRLLHKLEDYAQHRETIQSQQRQCWCLILLKLISDKYLAYSDSRLLFLIPAVKPKYHWTKMHTNKSLKYRRRICPTKMWLSWSYCHGKKWLECDEKLRPKIIVSSLKKCSKDRYPKFFVLLKLAAILPVVSCECTFSVLQHLR